MMTENKLVKSRKKLKVSFSPTTWFGRLCIIAGTIQIAIFCASLIINLNNNGDHRLISMVNLIVNTILMAFALPVSWFVFPMGLVHLMGQIESLKGAELVLWPWFIYLIIFTLAILINKRVIFFILYTILIIILITNVAGCAVMPKPGVL